MKTLDKKALERRIARMRFVIAALKLLGEQYAKNVDILVKCAQKIREIDELYASIEIEDVKDIHKKYNKKYTGLHFCRPNFPCFNWPPRGGSWEELGRYDRNKFFLLLLEDRLRDELKKEGIEAKEDMLMNYMFDLNSKYEEEIAKEIWRFYGLLEAEFSEIERIKNETLA